MPELYIYAVNTYIYILHMCIISMLSHYMAMNITCFDRTWQAASQGVQHDSVRTLLSVKGTIWEN